MAITHSYAYAPTIQPSHISPFALRSWCLQCYIVFYPFVDAPASCSSFALLILCCFYHALRLHLHETHARHRCRCFFFFFAFFPFFYKEHIRSLVSHFSRLFHAISLYIKWILSPLYFIVVAWCNSCDAFVISIFISFRISWAYPHHLGAGAQSMQSYELWSHSHRILLNTMPSK